MDIQKPLFDILLFCFKFWNEYSNIKLYKTFMTKFAAEK